MSAAAGPSRGEREGEEDGEEEPEEGVDAGVAGGLAAGGGADFELLSPLLLLEEFTILVGGPLCCWVRITSRAAVCRGAVSQSSSVQLAPPASPLLSSRSIPCEPPAGAGQPPLAAERRSQIAGLESSREAIRRGKSTRLRMLTSSLPSPPTPTSDALCRVVVPSVTARAEADQLPKRRGHHGHDARRPDDDEARDRQARTNAQAQTPSVEAKAR